MRYRGQISAAMLGDVSRVPDEDDDVAQERNLAVRSNPCHDHSVSIVSHWFGTVGLVPDRTGVLPCPFAICR